MSDYELIQSINDEHKIYLVKNIQDASYYVKKELAVYERDVYEYLYSNSFKGIPAIKEIREENNKLLVFEEYVSGESLEIMLEQGKRFKEEEIKDIIIKLCLILKELNKDRVFVHRDIKPSNIIIKGNGEVYLIDFNAAKFYSDKNRDTILLGTEGYAAPEQYGFGSSNRQSDIYGIGVLMKEMLTGSNNLNTDYKSALKDIISKCTRLDPIDRFQTYDELLQALKTGKLKKYHKYLPVGFRSGKFYKMLIATIVYLLIIYIGTGLIAYSDGEMLTGAKLTIERMGMIVTLVVLILFGGNYLNCQDALGINKISNPLIRIAVVILLDAVVGILCIILMAILQGFF